MIKRKEIGFMTNGESLPKGQTKETEEKAEEKLKVLSVEEVFNQYPVDRDKARDAVLMEMSKSLIRISASMDAIVQGLVAINTHLAESNTLKKEGK